MPKRVSLTRSLIGRVWRSRGAASITPRAVPAITRIGQGVPARESGGIALLIARGEVVAQPDQLRTSRQERIGGHQALGQLACPLRKLEMPRIEERRHAQRREAALPSAEQVSGAAQHEVLFGDG